MICKFFVPRQGTLGRRSETCRLLTVKQVAERLNCSEGFVYGQGGKRVSEAQVDEYLRSMERGGLEPEHPPEYLRVS
jgi:hypothetical protein